MARRRQKGTGEVFREGTGWAVRWRENGRRRYRGGFKTKEDAQRVLAKVRGEIVLERAGMPPDPRGFPTLAEEAEPWLERRKLTHRAAYDDGCRWRLHLEPAVGRLRPAELDAARIRALIEAKLAEGLEPSTVGHLVRLLSTFYSDLCERPRQTGVSVNPVRSLPRSTRRLMKPRHDPKDTPFLEKLDDVRRVYQALRDAPAPKGRGGKPLRDPAPEPYSTMYATGALGGLRTGEVLGLDWRDIDLEARRIRLRQQVQDNELGPLKDDEARTVPIQAALLPVLKAWHLKTGGSGPVFKPRQASGGRAGSPPRFIRPHTLHDHLRAALRACRLDEGLTWYQCTRHTFASQWVMANGSIEKLATVLGHSSTEVTRRYAHLKPEHFREEDRRLLDVDMGRAGTVVPMADRAPIGQFLASPTGYAEAGKAITAVKA
jgi:integrase